MSCEFAIDTEQRLVRIRMWGDITRSEIQALTKQIASDSRLGLNFSELIDLRELTSTASITADDVRTLASSPLDPVAHRAFVIPDPATFGLVRMFQSHRAINRTSEQIGVFRTLEEAEAWIASPSV